MVRGRLLDLLMVALALYHARSDSVDACQPGIIALADGEYCRIQLSASVNCVNDRFAWLRASDKALGLKDAEELWTAGMDDRLVNMVTRPLLC
jgi:hypothetical protein